MYKIILVEDDSVISMMLGKILSSHGYDVSTFPDSAGFYASEAKADLYILDISLPDGSGLDICEQIRKTSSAPIIMLTAVSDEATVVWALNAGADDYVIKPFRTQELLARIQAHTRRCQPRLESTNASSGLYLDTETELVKYNGQIIKTTTLEYLLLKQLITHKGQRVSREQLLNIICENRREIVEDNTLSVHLSRIRKKLKSAGCEKSFETCWGGGYRWLD